MNEEMYNLTFPQRSIFLVDKRYSNTSINMITGIININKDFDVNFCDMAINEIIKNNDAMRINIKMKSSDVYQIIKDYNYEKIEVVDMTSLSSDKIEEYIQNIANTKIDIFEGKLYEFKILKYSDTKGSVLLRIHHIISDAWSFSKIIEQFTRNYTNISEKTNENTNYVSYTDFIDSQSLYCKSDKYINDREYFREYLKDVSNIAKLKERTSNISNFSNRYNVKLDKVINDKIVNFCKENKMSPYVLFLTILSVYIYRIKNIDDIIIGSPVLNRKNFKEKQIIGLFISTLPIRIKINEDMKIIDLAKSVSSNTMSCFRHQRFPYDSILSDIRSKINIKENLYSVLLSYQNAKANYETKEKYSTKWYSNNTQAEDLQIHILDMDDTGTLEINYDYLSELFSIEEIKYLHLRLMAMIENLLDNVEVTVDNINIISSCDENLLKSYNNTHKLYTKEKSVIDVFEEQVERNKDNIALIFENRKITYNELNEKANIVANYLLKFGVKKNDIIPILMKRSEELVITILAILKCRCAYLPIDITYPEDRIEYILKNSKSSFGIKDRDNDLKLDGINLECIDFERLFINVNLASKSNLNIPFEDDGISYLIYTSGSTGNPKGVLVSNKNLINFVYGINEELKINSSDKIVSITTTSFDIFYLELFLPLINGATVVLANEDECINSEKLNKLCLMHGVTIIQTTPTKLKMLLNKNEYIYNMKKILLGGEKIEKDFVDRLKSITKANIYDVYGPTETTIWSTIQDITNNSKVSAGKPISNTKIYILDKKNRILPVGVSGQIGISGDGVSLGYYNNKEATEKNYIYSKELKEKIYLTGDLGRIEFNSTLSVLDRIDLQIKLNGQRIELEDIEKNIKLYDNIKEAVVVLKEDRFLVCYYIKENINKKIDKKDIIKFLYNKLPTYMIPVVYESLESFPLTLNGKIDRKKISLLDVNFDNTTIYEKPKTKLQEKIYKVFSKVLGRENFGINDRFFEMGADSLMAIKAQIELLSYGIHIEYKNLLKYQSVKELEKYIKRNKKEDIENILEKYEDYNDILLQNKVIKKDKIKKSNVGNILLTGVTGFLGMHILDSFMKNEKGKIYCIIRAKENKKSNDRFIELLHYYFGEKYDLDIGNRIILLQGNFIEENLGIEKEKFNEIIKDIDLVIHSAACVKHYGYADYFKKVNIDGTKNIAKFCYENNKKLIHISTISVSGNSFEIMNSNEIAKDIIDFDETCFYQEQNLDNIYVYTKFKAEEVILNYMKKGLEANILRVGSLTGRYEDLKFQYNVTDNAFSNKIKTFIDIGYFPKSSSDIGIEFTPVDSCADAIIKIMQNFNMYHNVFHLYDNNHVIIEEFIRILKDMGIEIKIANDEEFTKIVEKIAHSKNNNILKGIVNDLNEKNMLNYKTNVNVRSEYTQNYLKELEFYFPKIDSKYIKKYVEYLRKIGFIEK